MFALSVCWKPGRGCCSFVRAGVLALEITSRGGVGLTVSFEITVLVASFNKSNSAGRMNAMETSPNKKIEVWMEMDEALRRPTSDVDTGLL